MTMETRNWEKNLG